jgi:hypothetical protein
LLGGSLGGKGEEGERRVLVDREEGESETVRSGGVVEADEKILESRLGSSRRGGEEGEPSDEGRGEVL